jgi:hypothetical protein
MAAALTYDDNVNHTPSGLHSWHSPSEHPINAAIHAIWYLHADGERQQLISTITCNYMWGSVGQLLGSGRQVPDIGLPVVLVLLLGFSLSSSGRDQLTVQMPQAEWNTCQEAFFR